MRRAEAQALSSVGPKVRPSGYLREGAYVFRHGSWISGSEAITQLSRKGIYFLRGTTPDAEARFYVGMTEDRICQRSRQSAWEHTRFPRRYTLFAFPVSRHLERHDIERRENFLISFAMFSLRAQALNSFTNRGIAPTIDAARWFLSVSASLAAIDDRLGRSSLEAFVKQLDCVEANECRALVDAAASDL